MFPGRTPSPPAAAPPDPALELAWDAFRYVADALTPAEAAAFEARLGVDQAAREALAAAVDHFGAMAVAARDEVVSPFRPVQGRGPARARRQALIPLAAAAGLLGWWAVAPTAPPAPAGVPALTTAWSGLRAGGYAEDGPASGEAAPLTSPVEVGAEDGPAIEEVDVPANRPLPSWMLAAVAPAVDDGDLVEEGN